MSNRWFTASRAGHQGHRTRQEQRANDQGDPPQPYSLRPSYNPVAAGVVQFNVYNFGQDPHTFAVVDSGGHRLAFAHAPANQSQTAVPVPRAAPSACLEPRRRSGRRLATRRPRSGEASSTRGWTPTPTTTKSQSIVSPALVTEAMSMPRQANALRAPQWQSTVC